MVHPIETTVCFDLITPNQLGVGGALRHHDTTESTHSVTSGWSIHMTSLLWLNSQQLVMLLQMPGVVVVIIVAIVVVVL